MTRRPGTTPFALAAFCALAGLATSIVGPRSARCAERGPAFQLSLDVDAPVLLLGGALASSYFLIEESTPPACAPLCDRATVNALDRPFAGLFSRRWQTVGDVSTVATLLLVPLPLLFDEGGRRGLQDVVVVMEAVLMTSGTEAIVNYAVKRPRPRLYGAAAPPDERDDGNAGRSFFSGHAGNCFAATVASTLALRRLGQTRLAWMVFAAGAMGSAMVGLARIEAGSHFPTDVLAGLAVGASFGIAIPALHTARLQVAPTTDARSRGFALAGAF